MPILSKKAGIEVMMLAAISGGRWQQANMNDKIIIDCHYENDKV